MTDISHDLRLARAERDAYADTCEDLHRTIAGLTVEIEMHVGHREAADLRIRSLSSVLDHEQESSKGLVAQVESLRGNLQWARSRVKCAGNVEDPCGWRGHGAAVVEWEDNGETPRCPKCDEGCVEIDHEAEAHPETVDNEAEQLRAIRDLVAPGNPQGTVVDAVRARLDRMSGYEDIAIQRATDAERERDAAYTEAAKLRAEAAELRARPVLTNEAIAVAITKAHDDACARWAGANRGPTMTLIAGADVVRHLGSVTLPGPDRAEELWRKYDTARCAYGHGAEAMRAALAKLSPAPVAPVELTAASVDELVRLFMCESRHSDCYDDVDDHDRAGIRAVLAAARLCVVDAEGLHAALYSLGASVSLSTCREAIKRATARKPEVPRG